MNEEKALARLRRYELIGGLIYLGLFLSGLLTRILTRITVLLAGAEEPMRATLILNLLYYLLTLIVLIPLLRRWLAAQLRQLAANGIRKTAEDLLIGGGLILLALIVLSRVVAIVSALYPEYSNGNQESLESLLGVYPVWVRLMTCCLAPVTEELLFRGVLFCGIRPFSRVLAYPVSALAFALPHVSGFFGTVPPAVSAVNLLFYFTMGLILARVCERGRSVGTSILLHAIYNTVMTLLIR